MGIYDREYYRDATRGSGWLTGTAPVCRALIVANLACFLLVIFDKEGLIVKFLNLSSPAVFERGQAWRLVTSLFLHQDGWHIGVNMLVLWVFGRDMEALYGWRDFLA